MNRAFAEKNVRISNEAFLSDSKVQRCSEDKLGLAELSFGMELPFLQSYHGTDATVPNNATVICTAEKQ